MGEQRRIYLRGNSWVVPVPRVVRRHLARLTGGDLFWHVGPKGEAFVTTGQHRIGGKPPGARLDRDLTAALAQIERLQTRLAARPQHVINEGVAQGWAQAIRHAGLGPVWASRIEARLEEIARAVAQLPGARHRQRAARAATTVPAPVLAEQPPAP
jgi:hypothetical protein